MTKSNIDIEDLVTRIRQKQSGLSLSERAVEFPPDEFIETGQTLQQIPQPFQNNSFIDETVKREGLGNQRVESARQIAQRIREKSSLQNQETTQRQLNQPGFFEEGGFLEQQVVRPAARGAKAIAVGTAGTIGDLIQLAGRSAAQISPTRLLDPILDRLVGISPEKRSEIEEKLLSQPAISQTIGKGIDDFTRGLTTARNVGERIEEAVISGISSIAIPGGVALQAARAGRTAPIAQALTPTTAIGLTAEATGAGAAQAAQEVFPESDIAPIVAGLTGATVPSVGEAALRVPSRARAAIGEFTGLDPDIIEKFEAVGVKPTFAAAGEATPKIIQNTLADTPFSASTIRNAVKDSVDVIDKKVKNISENLSTASTPVEAGEVLQKGATGFIERFNARSTELYDNLKKFIPLEERVSILNTKSYLDEISQRFDDVPKLRSLFTDPLLLSFKETLDEVPSGKIKYNSLRNLRTTVGNKLNSFNLDGDQRAALNQLYGNLSEDMRNAAASKGDQALQAFERANQFYRSGRERIEGSLEKIINSDTPERAFSLATQGTRQGATQLNTLKKSLNKEEFAALQSTVLKRMGQATPGRQDETGQLFSVGTFLTNWNKLAPEAKNVLFGGEKTELRKSLNNLLEVTGRLKEVEQLANTSGTSRGNISAATLAGALTIPTSTITALGAAKITSLMMTKPFFVKWFADGAKIKSPSVLRNHLKKLPGIALRNPEIRGDLINYQEQLEQLLSQEIENDQN